MVWVLERRRLLPCRIRSWEQFFTFEARKTTIDVFRDAQSSRHLLNIERYEYRIAPRCDAKPILLKAISDEWRFQEING